MVNETSGATVTRLTPVVNISRSGSNQGSGEISGMEAQKLAVDNKATPQAQSSVQPSVQPSAQPQNDLLESVRVINEFVQSVQRDLSFNVDEASGRTVIKVIDRDSGDTVRQIPTEEVLAIASHIRDVRDDAMGQEIIPIGLLFSENT